MTVTNVQKDPQALTMTVTAELDASVERAWQLKKDPSEARVPWRIQQVIDKVKARAGERGMPPEMVEMVSAQWRNMIGWFVQYEEEKLRQSETSGGESK